MAHSVTEVSRSGGAYHSQDGDGEPPIKPSQHSSVSSSTIPPNLVHKPSLPFPVSSSSTPVPIHSNLPTTVPSDLIPPNATWINSPAQPSFLHPSTWQEIATAGPWPFTTLLNYRLPESGSELTWEARRHRRQVEQHFLSVPADVQKRRNELRHHWWQRILSVHIKRWSWWAVLWFNVGSHIFIYAAVCLFIPFFNTDRGVYQANTGWSSNVLAVAFWLAANLCEIMAIRTARPASKWFQVPHPLLPWNKRKINPHVYDCAYVDNPTPSFNPFAVVWRVDIWIPMLRMIAVLAFLIETISYSGAFNLTDTHRTDVVFVMGFLASGLFIITAYLSLAECCHQWIPVKKSIYSSWTFLDYWINVLNLLASFALLAYFIDLWYQPDLLDQRQGPAYPYLIMAVLFTASDWLQAIEQGEEFYFEQRNIQTAPAPEVEPSVESANEYRMDIPPIPPRPVHNEMRMEPPVEAL